MSTIAQKLDSLDAARSARLAAQAVEDAAIEALFTPAEQGDEAIGEGEAVVSGNFVFAHVHGAAVTLKLLGGPSSSVGPNPTPAP